MGGSGGTSIATTAMRALPVGVPKVMVSTVGGGDVSAYTGTKDITFIPSIVDVAGINSISRRHLYQRRRRDRRDGEDGAAQSAAARKPAGRRLDVWQYHQCVDTARGILEAAGYEVLVFHATGTGGKTMESLITDGYITASLDITTTELADEVCGGVFSAGPERGLAASRAGIPAILVPGCVDMANFGGIDTVPEKYKGRNLYQWNPNVTLLRTNVEENTKMGEMLAPPPTPPPARWPLSCPCRASPCWTVRAVQFWDPEADEACFEAIKKNLKPASR